MTRYPIGRLWTRYLEARGGLDGADMSPVERRAAEREVRGMRDRLVVNYSPLARYVAGRVVARATGYVDQEDVVSWGIFGLLDAVETYDPGRRTKFESYAISKIRWSIVDELRRADPLPRRTRQRVGEVERTRCALSQRLGRAPTETEVAGEMGVPISKHQAFLEQYSRAQVASLEARLASDGGVGVGLCDLLPDLSSGDPESAAEKAEVRAWLVEAIAGLGEQERVVTTFYYYDGLTLREIGKTLGLTEGRISQILRGALTRLRRTLTESAQFSGRM